MNRLPRQLVRLAAATTIVSLARHALADETPGLHPQRSYVGVEGPIPVEAKGVGVAERIDLVLMDADGMMLALPQHAPSGTVDLADVMPAVREVVRERQRACFLQMAIDGEPVGSALVVQPLLTRLVPSTVVAPHPVTGTPHTRIVGWRLEADGPGEEPEDEPGGGAGDPAPAGSADAEADAAARVFSGMRLYPERDVRLVTSHGPILVALRPDHAPNTAWNFRELARGGFYENVTFHRIVPLTSAGDPFVIQGGDPSGTGEGGPGYWLPLEPSGLAHDFGVISMARADHPDSAGSQFFFCLSRAGTARLDGQYCAFGYAVDGAEAILSIADVEFDDIGRGRPVTAPVILGVDLVPAPPRRPGTGRPDARITPPASPEPPPPGRIDR